MYEMTQCSSNKQDYRKSVNEGNDGNNMEENGSVDQNCNKNSVCIIIEHRRKMQLRQIMRGYAIDCIMSCSIHAIAVFSKSSKSVFFTFESTRQRHCKF